MKVTDRRWWAKGDDATEATAPEEPKLKPSYVEDLESRLAAKDTELQQVLAKYRGAAEEFEQARARVRKELSKDVERGRRALVVSFLDVLDNLDRALDAASDRAGDPFVQGVAIVRQQFLTTLEGLGVRRIDPVGQPFDHAWHEAVTTVAAPNAEPGTIVGVIRPGYAIGDEVLRHAQVAVTSS